MAGARGCSPVPTWLFHACMRRHENLHTPAPKVRSSLSVNLLCKRDTLLGLDCTIVVFIGTLSRAAPCSTAPMQHA